MKKNARNRGASSPKDGNSRGAKNRSDGRETGDSGRISVGARFLETQAELSSSRQRLLRQILDESNETFFLSSREMGRRYNVDSATIIRTIQALGYEKFADFAHDLREHFVAKITPYAAMKAAAQTDRTVADRVRQSVDKDLENLTSFRASLDPTRSLRSPTGSTLRAAS